MLVKDVVKIAGLVAAGIVGSETVRRVARKLKTKKTKAKAKDKD